MLWAIFSGIEGNLTAYEAAMDDLCRRTDREPVEALFLLGDVIGMPRPGAARDRCDNDRLVERLLSPRRGEPEPEICLGWWEEQCLSLYGCGRESEPTALRSRYGAAGIEALYHSVSRPAVEWMRSLDFAFVELDCLLVHGSTVAVEEELQPETEPWIWLDRLARMGARRLFCGRSGRAFHYTIAEARLRDRVRTLDGTATQTRETGDFWGVGVGTIGRTPGRASYVLYGPGSDRLEFVTVAYADPDADQGVGQGSAAIARATACPAE